MKTLIKFSLFLMLLGISFTACKKKTPGKTAQTGEAVETTTKAPDANAVKYVVDPANSKIIWAGSKPGKTHTGTINVSKGTLTAVNNNITGGMFEIDMTSLEVTDLQKGFGKEKLEAHLKGTVEGKEDDFFNIKEFPTATFVITSVTPITGNEEATHNITGNLTLKGQTKSITFPASVVIAGDKISAVAPAFKINRLEWGIKFMSKSVLDNLKDGFIEDEVSLTVNLTANKG
ncbi:MAG TPA: YceI family protein [Phaeodactylibacter sp.]|nr:YceI family protein [Phaeodactylibacter sp.]